MPFAKNLPLPQLAALLERSVFVGHDSGISHLAAAVGANCILLFGPTNPDIWAPKNTNVRVLKAPNGRISDLKIEQVKAVLAEAIAQPQDQNRRTQQLPTSFHFWLTYVIKELQCRSKTWRFNLR